MTKLIHKVLSGDASELEKGMLNKWMESDPANKQEFDEIKYIMDSPSDQENTVEQNDSFHDGLRKIKRTIDVLRRKEKKNRLYKILGLILTAVIFSMAIVTYTVQRHPFSKKQMGETVHSDAQMESKTLVENVSFDNVPLSDLFNSLKNDYGLVINVKSKELLACRFTGTFSRGISVDAIMYSLSKANGFNYTIDSGNFEIYGKGC